MLEKTQSWRTRLSPEDMIYYTRLLFSIISAAIALGFNLWGLLGVFGFLIGIVLIVSSYLIPVYILGVNPKEVGGHVRGIMKGLGTSILLFLVIWLLGFNFIYAASL
ncbi:MAG: hypothetical protein ACFE89_07745 [Candidatus Hodarchaeota archaeon]